MYFSLGRIDSVADDGANGKRLVLVDERAADEIEAERPLSVLLAAARVWVASSYGREHATRFEVRYRCSGRPPSFLTEVVSAAGGHVTLGLLQFVKPRKKPRELDAIIDEAFSQLAKAAAGKKTAKVALAC
jgi:hypothetical protein